MTEYRNIFVDKRSFTVLVDLPLLSDEQHVIALADDTYIARNGDTYIARDGNTYVAHNTIYAYPRTVGIKKRSFTVLVDKLNGS